MSTKSGQAHREKIYRQVAKTLRENTFEEGKETPRGEGKTISQLSQRDSQREKIYRQVAEGKYFGEGKETPRAEGKTLFQLPQRDGRWYAYRVSWNGSGNGLILFLVSGTLSGAGTI